MTILWDLDALVIQHGKHDPPNGSVAACAMEASYLRWAARQGWSKKHIIEGWTDSLACVCPYIGAFVRQWNDGISDDATRTRIFTPEILDLLPDTKGDDALMLRRMWIGIDWDIRTCTPAFLRLANVEAQAVVLESLPPIRSQEDLASARMACEDQEKVVAVRAAARDAARDTAWAAARDAAWAAARNRLSTTVAAMQASAVDLLRRMCAEKL